MRLKHCSGCRVVRPLFCVLFSSRDGELQAKSGKDNAENIGLGWKSELLVAVICSSLLFDVCWCLSPLVNALFNEFALVVSDHSNTNNFAILCLKCNLHTCERAKNSTAEGDKWTAKRSNKESQLEEEAHGINESELERLFMLHARPDCYWGSVFSARNTSQKLTPEGWNRRKNLQILDDM